MASLIRLLDEVFPDSRILDDARSIIVSEIEKERLGGEPPVPAYADPGMDIILKSFIERRYESVLGSHFVARVAAGRIYDVSHGIVHPGLFFVTLYYDLHLNLITSDITDEM